MMRFPSQPTGAGTAAEPVWLGSECGLRGCGKPRWVRPDGSLSEACCLDHVRLMAVATREVRGGGLDSPSVAAPAGGLPPLAPADPQPVGQQDGAPVSPVAYRGGVDRDTPLCAIEECVRPRYVTKDGVMLDCCGVTHGRELLVRQRALDAGASSAPTAGGNPPPPRPTCVPPPLSYVAPPWLLCLSSLGALHWPQIIWHCVAGGAAGRVGGLPTHNCRAPRSATCFEGAALHSTTVVCWRHLSVHRTALSG